MLITSSANCILDHVCNYNTYIIWIAPMCLTDYSQNVYMISNVYPQQVTAAQCFSHSSDKIIIITVISNWAWEESTARITPKRLLFIFCLFATTSASALWTTRRGLTLFIIHLKTATTPTVPEGAIAHKLTHEHHVVVLMVGSYPSIQSIAAHIIVSHPTTDKMHGTLRIIIIID